MEDKYGKKKKDSCKHVSLAKRVVENSEANGKSLIQSRNDRGSKDDLCKIPQKIFCSVDLQLATLVH